MISHKDVYSHLFNLKLVDAKITKRNRHYDYYGHYLEFSIEIYYEENPQIKIIVPACFVDEDFINYPSIDEYDPDYCEEGGTLHVKDRFNFFRNQGIRKKLIAMTGCTDVDCIIREINRYLATMASELFGDGRDPKSGVSFVNRKFHLKKHPLDKIYDCMYIGKPPRGYKYYDENEAWAEEVSVDACENLSDEQFERYLNCDPYYYEEEDDDY